MEKGVSKCRYDVRRELSMGNTGKKTAEARAKLTVCVYAVSLGAQCGVGTLCELSGSNCRAQ